MCFKKYNDSIILIMTNLNKKPLQNTILFFTKKQIKKAQINSSQLELICAFSFLKRMPT
jgi:hypothetical protein